MMIGLIFSLACSEHTDVPDSAPTFLAPSRSMGGCNSACETDAHPISEEEWLAALDAWREQPIGEVGIELETLLFHAKESKNWLPVYGGELPVEHRIYLEKELARNQVDMEMRLIDENGDVRGILASSSFPFKEKQHLPFSGTGSLGYLETSGKVKRVGVSHLWSRW